MRWLQPADGVRLRPLIEGAGTSLKLYRIEPGSVVGLHAHPYPELGLVLSGEGFLRVEEGERRVRSGDSCYIPGELAHGFRVPTGGEPVVMVDVTAALGTSMTPALAEALLHVAKAESAALPREPPTRRPDA
jgi:quercetin dioxygenase-like cupin family protein